jgi:zinc protease
MRKLVAALAVTLAAAMPARAAAPVTTLTLDNGMDVVVVEDHRAPAAVHMVWYRAGSADEPPGTSGVAHFLEHLMFKGTDTLAPGEFSATVARQGGRDNAFTSYDYTAYFQRVAADRLELMMRMESDRMANLRLEQDDVETERDVIIEERNQRVENNPSSLFRERVSGAQFLNHPYGTPIIGWQQEMSTLDRDDALGFYKRHYAPNNAILVVAGDVTPEEVETLARRHYGKLAPNPELAPRTRPQEPRQLAERRVLLEDPRVGQPFVMRSYLAPERDSGAQERAAALTILADLLGDGSTSVLNESLQFEDGLAVYTTARYSGTSLDDTTFELFVAPAPGVTLEQAEAGLDEVLAEFLETGVDPARLDRVKTQLRARQTYARDNVFQLANRYGRALTTGLSVQDVQAWPEILQSVTAEDVMAAARDVLDREAAVTGRLKAPEVTQ